MTFPLYVFCLITGAFAKYLSQSQTPEGRGGGGGGVWGREMEGNREKEEEG